MSLLEKLEQAVGNEHLVGQQTVAFDAKSNTQNQANSNTIVAIERQYQPNSNTIVNLKEFDA